MKNQFRILFAALTLAGLLGGVVSCKKNEVVPGLSVKIQNIVPQAALDDMKTKGLIVNEGTTPPNIEGIFEANPYKLLAPFDSSDPYDKDDVIDPYRFRLTGQNNDEVKLEYKQVGTANTGAGVASFLAGSGNKFTLFGQISGVEAGIPNKTLFVLTGEITTTGIKDFQTAILLTEKTGDANNVKLIPINKSRVWIDGNALASKVSSYRLAADEVTPVTNAASTGTVLGNR
jgi:hypothetical protein